MAYSFNEVGAAERHETQYFEMFVNRGIYHKGWTAVTRRNVSTTLRQLSLDFSVRACVSGDIWRLAEPVGADLGETRRNLRIGLSL